CLFELGISIGRTGTLLASALNLHEEFFHFLAVRFTIARVSASDHKPIDKDKDRLVSAVQAEDDASYELKLRPRYLREFIGQKKVKENLSVAVEAAKSRGEALDHVLLYGPPGLGKT